MTELAEMSKEELIEYVFDSEEERTQLEVLLATLLEIAMVRAEQAEATLDALMFDEDEEEE